MQSKKHRDNHIVSIQLLCRCIRSQTNDLDKVIHPSKYRQFLLTDASFNRLRNIRKQSDSYPNSYRMYKSEIRMHDRKFKLVSKLHDKAYDTMPTQKCHSVSDMRYLTNRKSLCLKEPTALSLLYQRLINKQINSRAGKEVRDILKNKNRFIVGLERA